MTTYDNFPEGPLPVTLRDAIRYRPAMYIGGADTRAVNFLANEVISGCLAKFFKNIHVTIDSDLSIHFNCTERLTSATAGVDLLGQCDGSTLQSFLIKDGNYLPCLNALASVFDIEVVEGGEGRSLHFEKGLPVEKAAPKIKPPKDRPDQCIISALLDDEIFSFAWFRNDLLTADFAALTARLTGLKIKLTDNRTNPRMGDEA